ncbi:MAG: carboxylating nicotinate-nucleotide diphosphorylase [Methylococcaceae bacterium]|nr:MAG: carboxylating nicotinate-nucleotide diphosphorylase [Methylococcaceae bacterium]
MDTVDTTAITRFLAEDLGNCDLTAAIIPEDEWAEASVVTREPMVLCGSDWFDAVFRQLNEHVTVAWHYGDGDSVPAGAALCELEGPARSLLTGERTALNLLQTLSGTASLARRYAEAVQGTGCTVLDTRKTLPGLRQAQKYAVRCGGCANHRLGLYDGILIKENHILAAGSIAAAVQAALALNAGVMIEVEVETLAQLEQALAAGAPRILLDNFSLDAMRQAVALTAGRAKLEVSGNVDLSNVRSIAATGVDYVSVGALTKHVQAVDLSMRITLVK